MRGTRSFRYGPRLKLTAPMAAMFAVVSTEMLMLAFSAQGALRIAFGIVGSLSTLVALAMTREVIGRLRGKKQIVVGANALELPGGPTIPFREIHSLALTGDKGFRRTLEIVHANGTVQLGGYMLGTVAELDDLHGLLRSVGREPREARAPKRRGRGAGRR